MQTYKYIIALEDSSCLAFGSSSGFNGHDGLFLISSSWDHGTCGDAGIQLWPYGHVNNGYVGKIPFHSIIMKIIINQH
jgi:hypothetical protein